MSQTAKKCEGAKLRGEVNLFPARERAWARGTTPLMLLGSLRMSRPGGRQPYAGDRAMNYSLGHRARMSGQGRHRAGAGLWAEGSSLPLQTWPKHPFR